MGGCVHVEEAHSAPEDSVSSERRGGEQGGQCLSLESFGLETIWRFHSPAEEFTMSGSFCRSLYAFNGDQHQQGLKFEAGELIKITQALEGGWWEGEKDGVKGWFPSTYVQMEVRRSSNVCVFIKICRDWCIHHV